MRGIQIRNTVKAVQPAVTTTTLSPGITQAYSLQHLDILSRYSRFYSLTEQFSPIINNLDRYISPLWIPIALIGCVVCTIIYANPQWRRSLRQDSGILMNPYGYASLSTYLLVLSILHLFQCALVVIIDLDRPWDTGLLACSGLICPLFHSLWTGNRLAIVLMTITLGIETLVLLQRETNFPSNTVLRWIIADGNSRKSVRIAVGVVLLANIYGLIETAYWRVQYYNSEYDKSLHSSLLQSSPSSLLSSSLALELLARCEVAGGFQYWFAAKPVNRYDPVIETDVPRRTAELAASYFDYQWITGITIDCSLALANLCIGLAIIRAYFMDDIIIRPRYAESLATASRIKHLEVLHIATICIIQGLFRLPSALFTMLDPLTRPGEMTLTDAEVSKDNTWQRFFLMLSAKVIGIELGDLPAALLLPICIGLCREFRQNFYALIQFKTPSKLRNTLASLNPRHSVSRIITPSPNLSGGIKKETYIQGSKRHLHQRLVNDRKLCQSETTRQIDPLCNYNMSKGDACDEASSERYIPDNRLHRQYEVQSETDGETAYDNTKSFHQCNSHHHQKDQHLQHTDATQLNKCSHRQNSPHIRPKRYEKLYDIRQHQQRLLPRYMYRSECDLHTSLPNSLFCSINHLSNQSYYHSKSGSFIHLQSKEDNISTNSLSLVNCDEIPIEVSKPILEHRSYV